MNAQQRAHEKNRIRIKHSQDRIAEIITARMQPRIEAIRHETTGRFLAGLPDIKPKWFFTSFTKDRIGEVLKTYFWRFDTIYKVDGLVKFNADTVEVLAIVSQEPGQGNCRAFIHQLQRCFPMVIIWHVDNPHLHAALVRYGFNRAEIPTGGATLDCMAWVKTPINQQFAAI